MQITKNLFKQSLKSQQTTYGLWLGLPHSACAEIAAGAGFDWLLVDCEHAPYNLGDVQHHLQAIAAHNVPALVRPVEGCTAILKQLLDIGAQSVLVPMVDTAEHAAQLVQDVRYPPQGIRGLGTSMARGAQWNGISDYMHKANDEICLIVQVETTTAIDNLDAIANTDGVDAVFIGPSDLSASMGYVGQPNHPDVLKVIENSIKQIKDAGKAVGILSVDPKMIEHFKQLGVNFIGVGVDASLLAGAARQLAKSVKQGGAASTPTAGY